MNIRHVLTRTGYVESNATACIIWTHEGRSILSSKELALASLAKYLSEKYHAEVLAGSTRACCVDQNPSERCSFCGDRKTAIPFIKTEFEYWFVDLAATDCDSFGDSECYGGDDDVWCPWRFPGWQGELVSVDEYAQVEFADRVAIILGEPNGKD